ncbi:MAG: ATP-binding protein [Jaaginema sp. PMC 1079.18]|nr:ATP-binding protein [Jaaginema sp. PMC 1080.18]MEC4852604.1 ATP-binding protein [Jaaginema sp. PMC 1079.18]MEC4866178.1 ATP-binding protein [Jaaginema sp. PMC 1078.18]
MKSASAQVEPTQWQEIGAEIVFVQDNSGKYLSFTWNNAAEYGVDPQTIVGCSLTDNFTPTDPQTYLSLIQRVLERRIPERHHEFFQHAGRSFPLELAISPILQPNGGVSAVLAIAHVLKQEEIATDTRHSTNATDSTTTSSQDLVTQIARKIRRNPYRSLLTEIARNIRRTLDLDTIWQQTVDSIGASLSVSRCMIVSYNAEKNQLRVEAEYCQKNIKSLLGERLSLASEPYLQQALSSGEPVAIERIANPTSGQRSVLAVATFYQNQRNALICLHQCDRRRYWTAAEIDLLRELAAQVSTAIAHASLYKELEQAKRLAEEASRLKSEFLASTSHELRTPLNGIIGFMRLILDGMADTEEEQREFLEEAHNSALHLLNLINDILDIAKIEAGKLELDFSDFSLNELFEDVEKKMRPLAERKNLTFEFQYPPSREPIILYGNYQRSLQVMLNLVGNAIKFTHEGGVTINAEVLKKTIKAGDRNFPGTVVVRVADTGIGVPLEKLDKLFHNFSQVDGSRTKAYGGTGLGLAISQKLIETMGGTINFFSLGEQLGSTVTFTVPLFQLPVMSTAQLSAESSEIDPL